jgi:hypothetical protein
MKPKPKKTRKLRSKTFKKMWIPKWPPEPESQLYEDKRVASGRCWTIESRPYDGPIPVSVVITELAR